MQILKTFSRISLALTLLSFVLRGQGQSEGIQEHELPEYSVTETRVANPEPAGTYPQLVSPLRFEPQVDLQSRNLAEGQGDVAIRGGIFENTGFQVGAATLFDPQTGHYFAEIPISPSMMASPEVATGLDNALYGFNTTVGTLRYGWAPFANGLHGEATAGFGQNDLNRQRVYAAYAGEVGSSENRLGVDFDFSRSESDGTRPYGDHDFARYAGRVQFRTARSQTDLFAGYQSKFFGWFNMYTPFNVNETEDLQTRLFVFNHRQGYGEDNHVEATAYYRRNKDHYVFDRLNPSVFEAFHETRVSSAGIQGRHHAGGIALNYSAQWVWDEIDSTTLVFGNFNSRRYSTLTALPEKDFDLSREATLTVSAGAAFDDTDRDGSKVSPMAQVALTRSREPGGSDRFYLQYASASQVPGYTAIASSSTGGLFRGNPDLRREVSENIEIGAELSRAAWNVRAAFFYRLDRDLLDWTFAFDSPFARAANNVDIDTIGFEMFFARSWERLDLILGYTWLDKSEDYGLANVDASFYALNFAHHRFTAALIYRPIKGVEIRADNEYRDQAPNPLRSGPGETVITSLGLSWYPGFLDGLELGAAVDNLFDSGFQEIPGVPSSRRQVSFSFTQRW